MDVKKDAVVFQESEPIIFEVSSAAKEAYKLLKCVMKSVLLVYSVQI